MNTWHIDDELFRRYQAGSTDLPLAGSVEAHLVACATCRRRIANAVATERREKIWQKIEVALDAPQPAILRRILAHLRFPLLALSSTSAVTSIRHRWCQAASAVACAILFMAVAGSVPEAVTSSGGRPLQEGVSGFTAPPSTRLLAPVPRMFPNSLERALLGSVRIVIPAELPALARSLANWSYTSPDVPTTGSFIKCQLPDTVQETRPLATTTALYRPGTADAIPTIIVVFSNPSGPGRLDIYVLQNPCTSKQGQPITVREGIPRNSGVGNQVITM